MNLPLNNYSILNTANVDIARETVGRVYCDHKLVPTGVTANKVFHACHNRAPIKRISVNFMKYTAEVLINPGCLNDFYLVHVPIQGAANVRTGATRFDSSPAVASIINPTEETSMVWGENCSQLLVQIEREAVEAQLSKLAGCEIHQPVVFEPAMSITGNKKSDSWWRFINYLACDIDSGSFGEWGEIEKSSIESTLITNLLYAVPHNYSALLDNLSGAIAPKHVKVAENYMLENISRAVSIADLVEITGLSARSLFDGFKRFRGVTPMGRFLQLKLSQIRSELLSAEPGMTVTEVTAKYGVTQQGRFAAQYRKTFGETPSQTLRNS